MAENLKIHVFKPFEMVGCQIVNILAFDSWFKPLMKRFINACNQFNNLKIKSKCKCSSLSGSSTNTVILKACLSESWISLFLFYLILWNIGEKLTERRVSYWIKEISVCVDLLEDIFAHRFCFTTLAWNVQTSKRTLVCLCSTCVAMKRI